MKLTINFRADFGFINGEMYQIFFWTRNGNETESGYNKRDGKKIIQPRDLFIKEGD